MKRSAAAVLALLVLAACGNGGGDPDDVAFAQGMMPHHQQALEMVALVEDADASPEVVDLASRIAAAQEPEIATLRGWLEEWDADNSGHDHGGDAAMGMATEDDLEALADLTGTEFDERWLTLMIAHHEGAVAMAEEQIAEGDDPEVTALAESVVESQQAEITEMKDLLA